MFEQLRAALEAYVPYDGEEAWEKQVMLDFLAGHPDALLRENRIAHFTATAWIVNEDRTKVLMAYHNLYKSWAWIGGHADGDGDLLRVVKKEVAEETGLTRLTQLWDGIYNLRVIPVESHVKRGTYVNSHLHLDVEYLFQADEADLVRVKADENSAVGWLPIGELERYVSEENMKPIYARLNEKLRSVPGK